MEGLKAIERDGYLPVLCDHRPAVHKLHALEAREGFREQAFDLAELRARFKHSGSTVLHLEAKNYVRELEPAEK